MRDWHDFPIEVDGGSLSAHRQRVPPVRARSPLTVVAVLFAAAASWTCSSQPPPSQGPTVSSTRPDILASRSEIPVEPEPAPARPPPAPRAPIEPFEAVDEGVLGLRMPIHDPSGRAMHAFHAGLERAQRGEGQARLLFYGASHVASDWFTNVIRKELQHRFGDAGHGFVLPVHPWRSYRHLGVHVDSDGADRWTTYRIRTRHLNVDRYGLAGIAMETSHEGAYGIVQTDDQGTIGRHASRFELFFLRQPEGGAFEVWIDGQLQGALETRARGTGSRLRDVRRCGWAPSVRGAG